MRERWQYLLGNLPLAIQCGFWVLSLAALVLPQIFMVDGQAVVGYFRRQFASLPPEPERGAILVVTAALTPLAIWVTGRFAINPPSGVTVALVTLLARIATTAGRRVNSASGTAIRAATDLFMLLQRPGSAGELQPDPTDEILQAFPHVAAVNMLLQSVGILIICRLSVYLVSGILPLSDVPPLLSLAFLAAEIGILLAYFSYFARIFAFDKAANLSFPLSLSGFLALLVLPLVLPLFERFVLMPWIS